MFDTKHTFKFNYWSKLNYLLTHIPRPLLGVSLFSNYSGNIIYYYYFFLQMYNYLRGWSRQGSFEATKHDYYPIAPSTRFHSSGTCQCMLQISQDPWILATKNPIFLTLKKTVHIPKFAGTIDVLVYYQGNQPFLWYVWASSCPSHISNEKRMKNELNIYLTTTC